MAKITKAEMPALAEQIVKCLGGKENVARINHCATRLRVNPVDMEKVDKDGLKRLHGVIGIDSSKAELQIIVGAIIEDLYLEVEKITGNGGGAVADDVPFWKKRPSEIFSSFLLLMAGCLPEPGHSRTDRIRPAGHRADHHDAGVARGCFHQLHLLHPV